MTTKPICDTYTLDDVQMKLAEAKMILRIIRERQAGLGLLQLHIDEAIRMCDKQ